MPLQVNPQTGKLIVHDSNTAPASVGKLMSECCCDLCLDPEYEVVFPTTYDYVFNVYSGPSSIYLYILVNARYSDRVEFWRTSSVGSLVWLFYDYTAISYSNSWTSIAKTQFVGNLNSPGDSVEWWWRLRLTNECGADTVLTPVYHYKCTWIETPEYSNCNSCSPKYRKYYVLTFSGLSSGWHSLIGNGVPHIVEASLGSGDDCDWRKYWVGPPGYPWLRLEVQLITSGPSAGKYMWRVSYIYSGFGCWWYSDWVVTPQECPYPDDVPTTLSFPCNSVSLTGFCPGGSYTVSGTATVSHL
jgi:hypothetical protein